MTELNHRIALIVINYIENVGYGTLSVLRQHFPDLSQALCCSEQELTGITGINSKSAHSLSHWREQCDIQSEIKLANDCGVNIITIDDESYPKSLLELHSPPICLYVRGNLDLLSGNNNLAIVGSRVMSSYGEKMSREFASAAAGNGYATVSGLARGIDTIAHTATLAAGGQTLAVLGGGLSHIYPYENIGLAEKIITNSGALISENPMQTKPNKWTFPLRNRIIAGLCRGTIVIEAGLQSGSLITASETLELGRSVFAVPGRADTPHSHGCHALIRDGAILTETFQDVLDELTLLPDARLRSAARHAPPLAKPEITLTEQESDILLLIPEKGSIAIDDIICQLDLPPSKLIGTLMQMEVRHIIRQLPGRCFERNDSVSIIMSQQSK